METAEDELLLELAVEEAKEQESDGADQQEDITPLVLSGDLEPPLPPPALVSLAAQARRAVVTDELQDDESTQSRADGSEGDIPGAPLLQILPPAALSVLSSQSGTAARDGRSSEWSSSRRTGRRASAGAIGHVAKETHCHDAPRESTTRILNGADESHIGHSEVEEKETEPPGHNVEGQILHMVQEPRLPMPFTLHCHHPPTSKSQNQHTVESEQSGEEDVHVPPDKEVPKPDTEEQKVELSGYPASDPRGDRGRDTDSDSVLCVSSPNEEPVGDEDETAAASVEPTTIGPISIETPEVINEPRVGSLESAVVPSLRHTFTTEVHESSPHNDDTVVRDKALATEPPASMDNDDQNFQRGSPSAMPETETEWVTCITDTGESYYYNPQTRVSQWAPPPRAVQADSINIAGSSSLDSTVAVSLPLSSSSSHSRDALFAAATGVEPFASQLQMMLQSGASVHEVSDAGLTPLDVACQCSNTHAASLLLYYGARPDGVATSDDSQESSSLPSTSAAPLFTACRHNQVELIQLLLDYGAPLNATDRDGNSLLHASIASQSQDALLYLLDLSSSSAELLNHCNHDGETPLHLAVKAGYADAARALLRYGAATGVEDSLGRTPLVLSTMENRIECVQLLQTTTESPDTEAINAYEETGRGYLATADAAPLATTTSKEEGMATMHDAPLDRLQAYIFQLLSGSAGNPELQQTVYQFCNQSRQQMSSLAAELQKLTVWLVVVLEQIVKQHEHEQKAQIEKLTFENTKVSEKLSEDQTELARVTELLESQQLELDTLRASHQALASRCEMLDGIARTAQEKLKRERAEHMYYEQQLQGHLRASMDENLTLVTNLNELEPKWSQWLEEQQQQQQQQQQQSQAYSTEKDAFYFQYEGEMAQVPDVASPTYEHSQYYSPAEGTGTLTPVDEPSEYYDYDYEYSNENENGDSDLAYVDDTATHSELERMRKKAPTASTPPISPSRVGAVWNKFFENMAVAAERNGDSLAPPAPIQQQQQQQQPRSNNAGYVSTSSAFSSSPASMFMAIRKSNFAELQQLLLSGMSPNVRDVGEKGTPLHLACELGDLDAMKLLCEFAADVEVRDESDNTPLLVACSQGHYECTKFLLQSAANLSAVNANGDSALHLAAWDGSDDCVEILFEYGIDPLATNNFALTPLANIKTRSPLRHKFDDLVDEHPMRRTLVLLEEFEQRGGGEEEDTEEEQEPAQSTGGDQQKSASPRAPKQKNASGNANQASETTSAGKTSWKEWLFSFGVKPKQEEASAEQDDRESDADGDGREEPSQGRQVGSEDDEEDREVDDSTVSPDSFADSLADPMEISLRSHEPLKPPPEIEAELQRAKLQLQRPAMLATRSYESDDNDGDNGVRLASSREAFGGMQRHHQQQQSFVAADRSRVAMVAQKKPASSTTPSSAHLRARYVDTFNTA